MTSKMFHQIKSHQLKSMSVHESQMASTNSRELQDVGISGDPIDRLRLLCLSRGATGILGLGRMFRRMDKDGRKHLHEKEFLLGLRETGMDVTEEESKEIFERFDANNSGSINIDEFMQAIHPPMSESRKMIIEKAFSKLDKTGDGIITIQDLKRVYNVQNHPLYRSGEESEEKIFERFLSNFDKGAAKDGHVTREEFINFYAAISASIDTDGYFDLMMRQCYKL